MAPRAQRYCEDFIALKLRLVKNMSRSVWSEKCLQPFLGDLRGSYTCLQEKLKKANPARGDIDRYVVLFPLVSEDMLPCPFRIDISETFSNIRVDKG